MAPALLYVLAVFYLGSSATDPLADISFDWKDKVLHAIVFGGMQLTLARAVRFVWPGHTTRRVALVSTAAAILCGGLLELWQAALPHRSAELLDFVADAVGAAAAGVWWARRQRLVAAES